MASWRQQQEQEEREQRELLVQKLERNLQQNLNVWREILNSERTGVNDEDAEYHSSRQRRQGIQEASTGSALRDLQHDGGLWDAKGLPRQAATEGLHPLGST
jgi:hypothetical protein